MSRVTITRKQLNKVAIARSTHYPGSKKEEEWFRFPDTITLEIQDEEKGICKFCSTERRLANTGARYLCNHFSEYCSECIKWRDEQVEKECCNVCPMKAKKEGLGVTHCTNKLDCPCHDKAPEPPQPLPEVDWRYGEMELSEEREIWRVLEHAVNDDRTAINQLIRFLEARFPY